MREKLIDILKQYGIIRFGKFKLTSGRESDFYMDFKKASTIPEVLSVITDAFAESIKDKKYELIVAPAIGGIAYAAVLSQKVGIPFIIIRTEEKRHGTKRQIEGDQNLYLNKKSFIIDDVITDGGTKLKTVGILVQNGFIDPYCKNVYVVADREEGGRENLEAYGINLESLVTISDFR